MINSHNFTHTCFGIWVYIHTLHQLFVHALAVYFLSLCQNCHLVIQIHHLLLKYLLIYIKDPIDQALQLVTLTWSSKADSTLNDHYKILPCSLPLNEVWRCTQVLTDTFEWRSVALWDFNFLLTYASRRHVLLPNKTVETGSWNFVSDGEQNIPDH